MTTAGDGVLPIRNMLGKELVSILVVLAAVWCVGDLLAHITTMALGLAFRKKGVEHFSGRFWII